MRGLERRVSVEIPDTRDVGRRLSLSPVGAGTQPAPVAGSREADRRMARFLEEARAILDQLEEGWMRREADRPEESSEERHRRLVNEAMGYLLGGSRETMDAVEGAAAALRRLAGMR